MHGRIFKATRLKLCTYVASKHPGLGYYLVNSWSHRSRRAKRVVEAWASPADASEGAVKCLVSKNKQEQEAPFSHLLFFLLSLRKEAETSVWGGLLDSRAAAASSFEVELSFAQKNHLDALMYKILARFLRCPSFYYLCYSQWLQFIWT